MYLNKEERETGGQIVNDNRGKHPGRREGKRIERDKNRENKRGGKFEEE